jgi:hypothetical protein
MKQIAFMLYYWVHVNCFNQLITLVVVLSVYSSYKIFWCIQSFAFEHVIFLILNKISLLCKLTMFLEIEKEVGVERRPLPPRDIF